MDQNDLHNTINNRKLEVKNTVFLYNEKIEKLKKYDINKIKLITFLMMLLSIGISYATKFVGIFFIIMIFCIILFISAFILEIYIRMTINKLEHEIKKLEKFFLELQSKM